MKSTIKKFLNSSTLIAVTPIEYSQRWDEEILSVKPWQALKILRLPWTTCYVGFAWIDSFLRKCLLPSSVVLISQTKAILNPEEKWKDINQTQKLERSKTETKEIVRLDRKDRYRHEIWNSTYFLQAAQSSFTPTLTRKTQADYSHHRAKKEITIKLSSERNLFVLPGIWRQL